MVSPDQGLEHSTRWGYPVYWAEASDKEYTVDPSKYGNPITLKIPNGARPNEGSDHAIIIYNVSENKVYEMWETEYNQSNDSWSASSTKVYELNSNGLHKKATGADSELNNGHRGLPPSIRTILVDEVASGVITHKLECFWYETGTDAGYYWPMVARESGKDGIIPEGIMARIKHSVDLNSLGLSPAELIIATALRDYGCIIGDNDGGTRSSLKLENDYYGWVDLDPEMSQFGLSVIPFSDYEFIEGGYMEPN